MDDENICIWQSQRVNGYKFWETQCEGRYEVLQERCPKCGRQTALVGFDAWWEARKSYHP